MKNLDTYELTIEMGTDAVSGGVFAISLVDKPAVGYHFLTFNTPKPLNFSIQNEDERVVLGVIMLADTPIYRNNEPYGEHYVTFSGETIKRIVQKYFRSKRNDSVTIDHATITDNVYLFESYIIDRPMGINPPNAFADIPDGSWVGKFKVENETVWHEIKQGTFKGFSIEGSFSYGNHFSNQNKKDNEMELKAELIKMKKQLNCLLFKLTEVATAEGVTLVYTGELVEGLEVFVYDDSGATVPAPDGTYTIEGMCTVTVAVGKVASLQKLEEKKKEDTQASAATDTEFEKKMQALEVELAATKQMNVELGKRLIELTDKFQKFSEQAIADGIESKKRVEVKDPLSFKTKVTKYFPGL